MRDGDEIRATKEMTALDERTGKYAGRSMMQRREFKYYNQRDELVARCVMSAVRTEREAGKEGGKYMSIPKAKYTASRWTRSTPTWRPRKCGATGRGTGRT